MFHPPVFGTVNVPVTFTPSMSMWNALLVNTLLTTPLQAIIGLVLIALGLPVYWYWSRINRVSYQ